MVQSLFSVKERGDMECNKITGVYKRRKPQATSLWKLLNSHFGALEEAYDDLYQKKFGFYCPVISHVVRKYLECGDLQLGNKERCFQARSLLYILICITSKI